MLSGTPCAPPSGSEALRCMTSLLITFTWIGRRPDCRLEREGEHILCT